MDGTTHVALAPAALAPRGAPRAGFSLTQGPVAPLLFHATLPLALALLVLFGVQLAESWLVGRLGPMALAALGFALPISLTIMSFGIGLGAGASAVVARSIGADDPNTPALATDALLLGAAVALTLAALGYVCAPGLLHWIGAAGEVFDLALTWLRLFVIGAVPLLTTMVALSIVRAAGDTRFQAAALAGAAVLGFGLDFPLAFGAFGWPGFGLAGVAVAGAVAWTLMLAVALVRLHQLGLLHVSAARKGFASSAARVLRIGLPAAGTNAIIPAAMGMFTAFMAGYGPAAVAGFALGGRAESLALTMFFALSAVANPFAAQNAGAGRMDRVAAGLRIMLLFCLLGGATLAVLFWLLGPTLARRLTEDPAVAAAAAHYFAILTPSIGAVGAIAVVNAAFNGIDRPFAAVTVSLARTFALGVPLAWAGGQLGGMSGTLAGILVANLLVGGAAAFWVLRAAREPQPSNQGPVGRVAATAPS